MEFGRFHIGEKNCKKWVVEKKNGGRMEAAGFMERERVKV